MSDIEQEPGLQIGEQVGQDIEVMLGEAFSIDIEIATAATITLREYDPEFVTLIGAQYRGPNPGEHQATFTTRFQTQRQGRTTISYVLRPNPLTPLAVLRVYNVTIIGF